MTLLNRYSVVIQPDDPDIIRFKFCKDKLSNTIGNYGSRNSMAHITILEFDATEEELVSIIEKLNKMLEKKCRLTPYLVKLFIQKHC